MILTDVSELEILLNWPANIKIPIIIRITPKAYWKYFSHFPVLFIIFCALVVKKPTKRNGIPNPRVYANNKTNALEDCVLANANIAPNAAVTHGVHPIANAAPKINDVT